MSFEECSRKGFTAVVIVAAHVLVLYALAVMSPAIHAVLEGAPLAVQFISKPEAESQPRWQPPPAKVVPPVPRVRLPDMAPIQIAVAPARPNRAIRLDPPRTSVAPPAPDRSVPAQISAVEYVREPAPRYPPQSRRLREEGLVVLRVVIDERGKACSIDIERSSGSARLDVAAREAVSRAEFKPYIEDGLPRRAQVLIPIEFSLKHGAA